MVAPVRGRRGPRGPAPAAGHPRGKQARRHAGTGPAPGAADGTGGCRPRRSHPPGGVGVCGLPASGFVPERGAPLPLHLGDVVQLRRPHPCGADRWQVLRVGADLRLQCLGCGRRILVARASIERRVRRIFPADPDGAPPAGTR
jgi:hypothetical protein